MKLSIAARTIVGMGHAKQGMPCAKCLQPYQSPRFYRQKTLSDFITKKRTNDHLFTTHEERTRKDQ